MGGCWRKRAARAVYPRRRRPARPPSLRSILRGTALAILQQQSAAAEVCARDAGQPDGALGPCHARRLRPPAQQRQQHSGVPAGGPLCLDAPLHRRAILLDSARLASWSACLLPTCASRERLPRLRIAGRRWGSEPEGRRWFECWSRHSLPGAARNADCHITNSRSRLGERHALTGRRLQPCQEARLAHAASRRSHRRSGPRGSKVRHDDAHWVAHKHLEGFHRDGLSRMPIGGAADGRASSLRHLLCNHTARGVV